MAAGIRSVLAATQLQEALRPCAAIQFPMFKQKLKKVLHNRRVQTLNVRNGIPIPTCRECLGHSRQLWAVFGTVQLYSVLNFLEIRGDLGIWLYFPWHTKAYLRKYWPHPHEMHLTCRCELFWSTRRPRSGSGSLLLPLPPHYQS